MLWVTPCAPSASRTQRRPRPATLPGTPTGPHGLVTCPRVAPVLRYFLDYQWFVDFAVYSTAVYVFTEGYYCLADPQKETNIGVLWCLLTGVFSMYPSADPRVRLPPPAGCRRGNPPPRLVPVKSHLRWKSKIYGFLMRSQRCPTRAVAWQ